MDAHGLVRKTFADMRKLGYIARMAFSCCRNCASYELVGVVKEKQALGAVFYSTQSKDDMRNCGDVYVCFGSYSGEDNADISVGYDLTRVALENGLQVEWNGTSIEAVRLVSPNKEIERE